MSYTIFEPSGYPNSMALDPIRGRLFITNLFNGPLTVINTRTRAVTAEVTLGTKVEPYPVTVDLANGMVYVDNYGSTNVWVVDEKTNKIVDTITVPITYGGVDVDPIRGLVLATAFDVVGGGATSGTDAAHDADTVAHVAVSSNVVEHLTPIGGGERGAQPPRDRAILASGAAHRVCASRRAGQLAILGAASLLHPVRP